MNDFIKSIKKRDPAAKSTLSIILTYPGVNAVFFHQIANFFHLAGFDLIARIISQTSRFFTGIEIHPGAKIGKNLFIDHGMGVVIGETSEIGNDVTIGHGVILHACTLEDSCLIGIGSIILDGAIIQSNSMIAAGSLVSPNKIIESGILYKGSPAKPARELTNKEIEYIKFSSKHYVNTMKQHVNKK